MNILKKKQKKKKRKIEKLIVVNKIVMTATKMGPITEEDFGEDR